MNASRTLRTERELWGGTSRTVTRGGWLAGAREGRHGECAVPAIDHSFEPNLSRCERGSDIAQIAGHERARHDRIVRNQNEVSRQD